MEFTTTTAYDIGCQVYAANFNGGYVGVGPCMITTIEINISADRTKILYYINKGDTFVGCFPEDRIFRTHEECMKWCEEHA